MDCFRIRYIADEKAPGHYVSVVGDSYWFDKPRWIKREGKYVPADEYIMGPFEDRIKADQFVRSLRED